MNNPASPTVCLDARTVEGLMTDILLRFDVPEDECATVVEALLEASLSVYDSHGIMRIPMYVGGIRRGDMIPGAKVERIRETPSSVYLNAGWGLGPVAATEAVRLASEKAEQVGVGCASIVNGNDIGRLGSYLFKPARAGLVALMMVNDAGGGPCAAPWGGVDAFLSTNPIAAGIPWEGETPVVIDLSTSVVSAGQLKVLASRKADAPEGWLMDGDGNPTLNVSSFFASPKQSALLPLGGLIAGHKGFALGLLVDILAGVLSGAGASTGVEDDLNRNGVFVLVIDPETFVSREQFQKNVTQFMRDLKNARKAPGVEEILIPGERAYRERQSRLRNGIPIEGPIWDEIGKILKEVGLEEKYALP